MQLFRLNLSSAFLLLWSVVPPVLAPRSSFRTRLFPVSFPFPDEQRFPTDVVFFEASTVFTNVMHVAIIHIESCLSVVLKYVLSNFLTKFKFILISCSCLSVSFDDISTTVVFLIDDMPFYSSYPCIWHSWYQKISTERPFYELRCLSVLLLPRLPPALRVWAFRCLPTRWLGLFRSTFLGFNP